MTTGEQSASIAALPPEKHTRPERTGTLDNAPKLFWQALNLLLKAELRQLDSIRPGSEGWQNQIEHQLQALLYLNQLIVDLRGISKKDTVETRVFFHDTGSIINTVTGYAGLALDELATGLNTEESQTWFATCMEEIQEGIQKLLVLLNGFDMETGKINLIPESLSNLLAYISKNIVAEAKNSLRETEETRRQRLNLLSRQQKQQLLLKGGLKQAVLEIFKRTYPQIIFQEEVAADIDESFYLAELNSPTFVRIFDNIYTNTKKAYLALLKESHFFTDLDPLLVVTVRVQPSGLHLVFEDQAGGFPTSEDTPIVQTDFDQSQAREYLPALGKTKWEGGQLGTGTGLAGLADTINGIDGGSFRCFTLLDENGQPRGARTEIFIPIRLRDEPDQQSLHHPHSRN